jgi:hypothetical protein
VASGWRRSKDDVGVRRDSASVKSGRDRGIGRFAGMAAVRRRIIRHQKAGRGEQSFGRTDQGRGGTPGRGSFLWPVVRVVDGASHAFETRGRFQGQGWDSKNVAQDKPAGPRHSSQLTKAVAAQRENNTGNNDLCWRPVQHSHGYHRRTKEWAAGSRMGRSRGAKLKAKTKSPDGASSGIPRWHVVGQPSSWHAVWGV